MSNYKEVLAILQRITKQNDDLKKELQNVRKEFRTELQIVKLCFREEQEKSQTELQILKRENSTLMIKLEQAEEELRRNNLIVHGLENVSKNLSKSITVIFEELMDGVLDKIETEPTKNFTSNGRSRPNYLKVNSQIATVYGNAEDSIRRTQTGKNCDLFGGDDEERMEVIESDEEKPVIAPPKKSPVVPVPKNKRRKAVEKTYEDEDGYIVTRTEYVLVSASEDEEEKSTEAPKKEDVKPKLQSKSESNEDKVTPPVKGGSKGKKAKTLAANQPTLMNFFKKK